MTTSENLLQNERQEITEQVRCPMIRFIVDDAACVLRYSHLMRAECRTQNGRDQIEVVWPRVTVTIEGYHLDLILDWLAQQRLHSVTLHTGIEQERKERQPYLERILFADNAD
jgi:hypothetical protein